MNNMQKIKFVLVAPCYKRCLAARSDAGIKIAFLRVYTVICNDIMKEKSFWTVFHQLFPVSTGFTDYLFVLMRTWKLVFHFFILNVCRGLNGTLSIQSLSEGICGCGILESLFSLYVILLHFWKELLPLPLFSCGSSCSFSLDVTVTLKSYFLFEEKEIILYSNMAPEI